MWIDSSDFPLERLKNKYGKSIRGKKSEHWSYKLNRPGRRFHFVADGKTRILFLSHGYSPKLYDGQYVIGHRAVFETMFAGGNFIADDHYSIATVITDPSFTVPARESAQLTVRQRQQKAQIHALRARVEMPFGWIKNTFEALNQPWAGDLTQLDHLVAFAVGVHNRMV